MRRVTHAKYSQGHLDYEHCGVNALRKLTAAHSRKEEAAELQVSSECLQRVLPASCTVAAVSAAGAFPLSRERATQAQLVREAHLLCHLRQQPRHEGCAETTAGPFTLKTEGLPCGLKWRVEHKDLCHYRLMWQMGWAACRKGLAAGQIRLGRLEVGIAVACLCDRDPAACVHDVPDPREVYAGAKHAAGAENRQQALTKLPVEQGVLWSRRWGHSSGTTAHSSALQRERSEQTRSSLHQWLLQ